MHKRHRFTVDLPDGSSAVFNVYSIIALGGSAEGTKVFLENYPDGLAVHGVSLEYFMSLMDEVYDRQDKDLVEVDF